MLVNKISNLCIFWKESMQPLTGFGQSKIVLFCQFLHISRGLNCEIGPRINILILTTSPVRR